MASDKVTMRFISTKTATYLRRDDVMALLILFASTEETDVRNRMSVLIANLQGAK